MCHTNTIHCCEGPVVRISPYELHVHDPGFVDGVYPQTGIQDKYGYYSSQFG